MKVLIINTYHYLKGGDCRNAFDLSTLLKKNNFKVHFFSMNSGNNLKSVDSKHFVSEIDFGNALKRRNIFNVLNVLWRTIYSFEAKKKISEMLDEIKPDIVHLHSIRHHLTKSVLTEIKKRKIPIVWTLHDYKEICPNTSFYDGRNICEKCKRNKIHSVVLNQCKKGSLLASIATYFEAIVNGRGIYDDYIDTFIAPSKFLKNKFVEFGYDNNKIICLPNPIDTQEINPLFQSNNYFLYLGRLEKEKGLKTLINGLSKIEQKKFELKIVGTGEMEEELKNYVYENHLENIHFLGFKQGDELIEILEKAMALVIPSEWYENYPYVALEGMACGKPIIASRIGGLPEMVEAGINGLLFEAFNEVDLTDKINNFVELNPDEKKRMGQKGRERVEKINHPNKYISEVIKIYDNLLSQ